MHIWRKYKTGAYLSFSAGHAPVVIDPDTSVKCDISLRISAYDIFEIIALNIR